MSRFFSALALGGLFAPNAPAAPTARVGGVGVSVAHPAGWHSWRAFSVYILGGREASAATVARARTVLDSLRVRPR